MERFQNRHRKRMGQAIFYNCNPFPNIEIQSLSENLMGSGRLGNFDFDSLNYKFNLVC